MTKFSCSDRSFEQCERQLFDLGSVSMALYLCDGACYQCLNCPAEDVSRELCDGKYPAL